MDVSKLRAELLKRHENERESLESQLTILQAIPESLVDVEWSAHVYRLYDRSASLTAKYNRYTSIQKHPNPTLQNVIQLAEAFPIHAPLVLFRAGSVGIRTAENVEAMTDDQRDRADLITSIAPFWVRIQPSQHSQELEIGWIARIADRWVDCKVEFPLYGPEARTLGSLEVRYKYADPHHNHIASVETNRFTLAPRFEVFGNCAARLIKYGSGSADTPGDHLIYWENGSVDDPSARVEEFANRMLKGIK